MADYQTFPVDHDPFTTQFTPVDHDPFSETVSTLGKIRDALTPEWAKPFAGMSAEQANREAQILNGLQAPGKIGPGYLSDTQRLGMAAGDVASWALPEVKAGTLAAGALKGAGGIVPMKGVNDLFKIPGVQHYSNALMYNKITPSEFGGFMEALGIDKSQIPNLVQEAQRRANEVQEAVRQELMGMREEGVLRGPEERAQEARSKLRIVPDSAGAAERGTVGALGGRPPGLIGAASRAVPMAAHLPDTMFHVNRIAPYPNGAIEPTRQFATQTAAENWLKRQIKDYGHLRSDYVIEEKPRILQAPEAVKQASGGTLLDMMGLVGGTAGVAERGTVGALGGKPIGDLDREMLRQGLSRSMERRVNELPLPVSREVSAEALMSPKVLRERLAIGSERKNEAAFNADPKNAAESAELKREQSALKRGFSQEDYENALSAHHLATLEWLKSPPGTPYPRVEDFLIKEAAPSGIKYIPVNHDPFKK